MKRIKTICICCIMLMIMLSGCRNSGEQNTMKDGTYTAQMADYSFGWREYVTITVKNKTIVATEYNAENPSGLIKSWDNDYMANMNAVTGTYPNEYTRYYAAQLTGETSAPEIEVISGASSSGENFKKLSVAVINQAIIGDSKIKLVE